MPGGDRTGPWGAGARSGRAAGYCAGYDAPGYMNPGFGWGRGYGFGRGFGRGWGMGMGFGRGGGRGWRHWYYATGVPGWARGWYGPWAAPSGIGPSATAISPERDRQAELADLKDQGKYFQDALEQINRRIEELEKQKKT